MNASFGGGGYSQAIADAIASSPNTLFVVAAGNSMLDLDEARAFRSYPCSLPLDNIICVAASDQRDRVARYSNWSPVSVDLAAPGTEVLSTYPEQRVVFYDDFEAGLDEHWITEEPRRWGRSQRAARSGSWSLSDSPSGPYPPSHEVHAELREPLDLRGEPCDLELFVDIDTGRNDDSVRITYSADTGGSNVWGRHGAPVPLQANVRQSLEHTYKSGYRLSVGFQANYRQVRPSEGVEIDDLRVECLPADAGPDGEQLLSGTSMAAPHVTGVAALLWSAHPDWTVAQVRERILGTVDRLETLSGKVATGGRLNAHAALSGRYTQPLPIGDRPVITTVADGLTGPRDVASLPHGGFVVAETGGHRLRRVAQDGTITTIAGTGVSGYSGDGGPATAAQLNWPSSISVEETGAILLADEGNDRVRRIDPAGTIQTVASLESPTSVSAIPGGGFYVVGDYGSLYRVSADGTMEPDRARSRQSSKAWTATSDGGALVSGNTGGAWRVDPAGHATQVVGAERLALGARGRAGEPLGAVLPQ